MQEVTGVGEVIARIDKRLADGIFVTHRRHGRHFGQQAERRDFTVTRIVHIQRVMIERRQRAGYTTQYCHRMGVATEAVEQTGNLLMNHGVAGNGQFKFVELRLRRFSPYNRM